MHKLVLISLAGIAALLGGAAPAGARDIAGSILAAHNAERIAAGSPPLLWDPVLAAGAAGWANYLAAHGQLIHSDRKARPGVGENLAIGPRGGFPVEVLFRTWSAEKRLFVPGLFPANSRTGNWADVSHYTQLIWPTTTRVGCALAKGPRADVLVCRYAPKGNVDGRAVPARFAAR